MANKLTFAHLFLSDVIVPIVLAVSRFQPMLGPYAANSHLKHVRPTYIIHWREISAHVAMHNIIIRTKLIFTDTSSVCYTNMSSENLAPTERWAHL